MGGRGSKTVLSTIANDQDGVEECWWWYLGGVMDCWCWYLGGVMECWWWYLGDVIE